VKDKISKVMAASVRAKKPPVSHMRKPGQGMPEAGITSGKGPFDGFGCDAGLNVWVFINIHGVIVVNKIISADLVKNCYDGKRQSYANPKLVKIVELMAGFVRLPVNYIYIKFFCH